jgi:hypothetical protein
MTFVRLSNRYSDSLIWSNFLYVVSILAKADEELTARNVDFIKRQLFFWKHLLKGK